MKITCRDCGKEWSGDKTAHCTRCHETFTTDSNCDKHRIIERGPGIYRMAGCTPPVEVVDKHGTRLLFWSERRQAWSGPPRPDAPASMGSHKG